MDSTQPDATPGENGLEAVIDDYLDAGHAASYHRDARSSLTTFREWCDRRGVETVADVDQATLKAYADRLRRRVAARDSDPETGIARTTAHKYWDHIAALLSYCVEWGYLDANPAHDMKVRDRLPDDVTGSSGDQQFWSDADRERITRYVDERAHAAVDERGTDALPELRDRALVYLLAYTGARGAELLRDPDDPRRPGLQWADVHIDDGVLVVLGKSRDIEQVQLPRQARPPLQRLRQALAPAEDWPVIPSFHAPSIWTAVAEVAPDAGADYDDAVTAARAHEVALPALTVAGGRRTLRRLCSEAHADITPTGGHDYLTLHGARRGVGEKLYRDRGHAAAQRALRHNDPEVTSRMYSHIEAGELAEDVSDVFDGGGDG